MTTKHFVDIQNAKDAREMKQRGKHIRNYNDAVWKESAPQVIHECVQAKVHQVKEYLLSTGDKGIGEGSPDPFFGVGLHISDPRVLHTKEWTGSNIMGKALVEVRSELKLLTQLLENDPFLSAEETSVTSGYDD